MSSIHKVIMYIVDIEDDFNENELEYMFDRTDWWCRYNKVESADIGEWHDEHPLNYTNCPIETHESYFKK